FQITVTISPTATGIVGNMATVTPPNGVVDPDSTNNSATDNDLLTPSADLSIAKTDGRTSVVPGTNTTYTITVTNNGPSTVTGAVVTDVLPTGTTYVGSIGLARYDAGAGAFGVVQFTTGTLAPGESESFLLTLAIDPGLTGLLSNTATV